MSMPVYLILITSLLTLVCSNAKPKGGFENTVFETQDKTTKFRVETVAGGLEVPWGFAWLPNKDLLFTERRGRVRIIESGKHENLLKTGGLYSELYELQLSPTVS